MERGSSGGRGPAGGGGGATGGRPALCGRGRLPRLPLHGAEEALPPRHLQPAEAGAPGAASRAGLYVEAARGGTLNLVTRLFGEAVRGGTLNLESRLYVEAGQG